MSRGTPEYNLAKTQATANSMLEHARKTPGAKILIVHAGARPDDDEPRFVLGGWKAYRERWNNVRTQKPTHWMATGLVKPKKPLPDAALAGQET